MGVGMGGRGEIENGCCKLNLWNGVLAVWLDVCDFHG